MIHKIKQFLKCRSGTTAIEYGLICAAVSITIVATLFLFGNEVKAVYTAVEVMLIDAVAQR